MLWFNDTAYDDGSDNDDNNDDDDEDGRDNDGDSDNDGDNDEDEDDGDNVDSEGGTGQTRSHKQAGSIRTTVLRLSIRPLRPPLNASVP